MTPGGATPMGPKAMAMATPSPSKFFIIEFENAAEVYESSTYSETFFYVGQLLQMTPEQLQAYRWEKEIDDRNRPLSDDELETMFPPGYKVLPPPAG